MKKRLSKSIRNEKGQALAIVLALLAIGALTIVPLLHYTYTGLSASRIYDEKMELSYAAEAGLEDGIWKTDNEDMQEEPYNLEPYEYDIVYNYSLPEEINGKSVSIDIKQVWPLAGLESDAYGTEPVDNLAVTGGVVDALGRFQVRLTYSTPEVELLINRVAVWLPPGFEYDAGSSKGLIDDLPVEDQDPFERPWNGGTALEWDFFDSVNFKDLPLPGAGDPLEGGMQPGAELSVRVLEFKVTPQAEVAKGSYSWVKTTDIPDPYLSWEHNVSIYRIDSTATDNTTGKTAVAKGYTYVSEGVETDWINTGGLFTGNYRAVGNTLMLDEDGDGQHTRETLLGESSSTISNIPGDGKVEFAYLYWAGWHNDQEEDTTCTFKINPVEIITPNASGNHTECTPYGDFPNYECVDEAPPDKDTTYVKTGYAPEILTLRPNANGDSVEFEDLTGAPTHWEAVDEEVADDDTTYVGSDEAGRTDLFELTDSGLAPGTGIISVTVYERVRRESYWDDEWRIIIKSGIASAYSSTFDESDTWVERSCQWTTDPNTGQPWTVAAVDALQAGADVVSGFGGGVHVSQVYVEVDYSGIELTSTLRPNANGDSVEFEDLTGAPTHWEAVDEEVADDATTHVGSDIAGRTDLFELTDSGLAPGTGIISVTVYERVRRESSWDNDWRIVIKSGTNSYYSSTFGESDTWVERSYQWTTDPDTGQPWTVAAVDALQVGAYVVTGVDVSQVYVEVDYSLVEAEIDTYNLEDHSQGSGTINSVTVYIRTRATSGTHAAEVVIRTHGTDYFGNYTSPVPTSYTDISATWTTNPNTSSAWTWAEIDALEAGVKHYNQGAGSVRTTRVYVYVDYGSSHEEEITADTWWTVPNLMGHSYSCFKNVTSIVYSACPGGNAIYTVGDVDGDTGNQLSYAGWSLIIIYSSLSEDGHQFYLWNVLLYAGENKSGTFYIEGFQAPADAKDVEAAVTCFACEGDAHYKDGDTMAFNGEDLTDDYNPLGNIWNSQSSGLGGETIDGVDIDTFDVSSLVNPGATSAEIRFTTVSDHWNLIYLFLAFRSDISVLIPSGTGIYSYGF